MKYNINSVKEATCPLCCLEDEDLKHMLLRCPALSSVRSHHLTGMAEKIHSAYFGTSWGLGRAAVCDCGTPWTFLLPFFHIWSEHFRDRKITVQLLVDCSSLIPSIIPDKTDIILAVESYTRHFCYKLHLKRLYLHKHLKDDLGDNMAFNPSCNNLYIKQKKKKHF